VLRILSWDSARWHIAHETGVCRNPHISLDISAFLHRRLINTPCVKTLYPPKQLLLRIFSSNPDARTCWFITHLSNLFFLSPVKLCMSETWHIAVSRTITERLWDSYRSSQWKPNLTWRRKWIMSVLSIFRVQQTCTWHWSASVRFAKISATKAFFFFVPMTRTKFRHCVHVTCEYKRLWDVCFNPL
jgi:hypothetical protein